VQADKANKYSPAAKAVMVFRLNIDFPHTSADWPADASLPPKKRAADMLTAAADATERLHQPR
jgi:hypothetical protein